MKRQVQVGLVACVIACLPVGAWAADTPRLAIAAGAGGTTDSHRQAQSGYLGFSVPLAPWCAVGAEFGDYWLARPMQLAWYPETVPSYSGAHAVSASLTSRFSPPSRAHVSPYVTLEAGWSQLRWGDVIVREMAGGSTLARGRIEHGLCTAVGCGVRGQWGRPAPSFELGVRYATLASDQGVHLGMFRLALLF